MHGIMPLPCPPKDSLPAYLGHNTENKNPNPFSLGRRGDTPIFFLPRAH